MGFWEQLPYTNFHDLNLTELVKFINETIKKINEMSADIAEQNQVIEDFKTYVMNYLNNLNVTQDVRDYIDELITNGTMRDIIDESNRLSNVDWSNRRCLFLGDSYMTGWSPDGDVTTKFVEIIANELHVSAYWNYSQGGAGFSYNRPIHYVELFNNFVSDHPNEEVTDIFIMGGYNDNTETRTDIINSSVNPYNGYETIDAIRTVYPNALIHIAYIGRGTGVNTARSGIEAIEKCANYYMEIARDKNCNYIARSEYMLHDYRGLSSDGIHPNQSGHDQIGYYTASVLLYGYYQYSNIGEWHRLSIDNSISGTTKTKLAPAFSPVPFFEKLTNEGVIIQGRYSTVNLIGSPITGVTFDGSSPDTSICFGKICGNSNCRNFIGNFGSTNEIVIPVNAQVMFTSGGGNDFVNYEATLVIDDDGTLYLNICHLTTAISFPGAGSVKFIIIPAFEYTIPLNAC